MASTCMYVFPSIARQEEKQRNRLFKLVSLQRWYHYYYFAFILYFLIPKIRKKVWDKTISHPIKPLVVLCISGLFNHNNKCFLLYYIAYFILSFTLNLVFINFNYFLSILEFSLWPLLLHVLYLFSSSLSFHPVMVLVTFSSFYYFSFHLLRFLFAFFVFLFSLVSFPLIRSLLFLLFSFDIIRYSSHSFNHSHPTLSLFLYLLTFPFFLFSYFFLTVFPLLLSTLHVHLTLLSSLPLFFPHFSPFVSLLLFLISLSFDGSVHLFITHGTLEFLLIFFSSC